MYLVQDKELVLSRRGAFIENEKKRINEMDQNGLEACENDLLQQFQCNKIRADILFEENKPEELLDVLLTMTALNILLFKVMELNPKSELREYHLKNTHSS